MDGYGDKLYHLYSILNRKNCIKIFDIFINLPSYAKGNYEQNINRSVSIIR